LETDHDRKYVAVNGLRHFSGLIRGRFLSVLFRSKFFKKIIDLGLGI
jgi:hypothetical protein